MLMLCESLQLKTSADGADIVDLTMSPDTAHCHLILCQCSGLVCANLVCAAHCL